MGEHTGAHKLLPAAMEEARNRAALAEQAKADLLANISHSIRTPMNGVLGMAELLGQSKLDSRQQTFVEIIVKSGNALLTILNDLLDFSRIDAGQIVLEPVPFNLSEAIADAVALVSARAREKNLELIVRVQPGLHGHYVGDVGRFRQIVANLLDNALKFTDSGHVFVNVAGDEGDGESRLKIAITDTGIGVPPDQLAQLARVFDKFSQVDASTTRRHQGTGLGLAIASGLVALMGGRIRAESCVGEGSTFHFTICLPRAASLQEKQAMPAEISGARILVVDDNAVTRSVLLEQMAGWGFDACAARNGEEAFAVLKAVAALELRLDCLVLDYHMPVMSGRRIARIVRATPQAAHLPIIMLTGVDQPLCLAGGQDLAIDRHLVKPACSSKLLEAVVSAIRKGRAAATLAR